MAYQVSVKYCWDGSPSDMTSTTDKAMQPVGLVRGGTTFYSGSYATQTDAMDAASAITDYLHNHGTTSTIDTVVVMICKT